MAQKSSHLKDTPIPVATKHAASHKYMMHTETMTGKKLSSTTSILLIYNLHLDSQLGPVRTSLERIDRFLDRECMGDQPVDTTEDPFVDQTDDHGPRLLVSEGSDNVDLSESHRHERKLDSWLAAADLKQSSSILESLHSIRVSGLSTVGSRGQSLT